MFDLTSLLPLLMANTNASNDAASPENGENADGSMEKMRQMTTLLNALSGNKSENGKPSTDKLLEVMAAANPSLAQNMQLFKMLPMLMENNKKDSASFKEEEKIDPEIQKEDFAAPAESPRISTQTVDDNGVNYSIYKSLKDIL